MQSGANWNVNTTHVKLLEVHQFLGRESRNLFKNDSYYTYYVRCVKFRDVVG